VLTSNQKGAIAEAAVVLEAARRGIAVLRPVVEGGRYDLVFDLGGRFVRVQCKWATRRQEVIVIRARTCRRGPGGRLVRSWYSPDEIDFVAGYWADGGTCYLLPVDAIPPCGDIQLRLGAAKNNQIVGLNWAADYEFGAIAQLGERVTGSHEVAGSSPASSTPH
jgi:hypothetical protein